MIDLKLLRFFWEIKAAPTNSLSQCFGCADVAAICFQGDWEADWWTQRGWSCKKLTDFLGRWIEHQHFGRQEMWNTIETTNSLLWKIVQTTYLESYNFVLYSEFPVVSQLCFQARRANNFPEADRIRQAGEIDKVGGPFFMFFHLVTQ